VEHSNTESQDDVKISRQGKGRSRAGYG
jgi:hypothetical protein